MKSWVFYYYHAVSFSVGIPLLYAYPIRKSLTPDLKALVRYLLVTLLADIIFAVLPYFMYNTVWVDNCYLPLEVALTMWVFLEMQNSSRKKMIVMYSILGFSLLWFIEFLIKRNPFAYGEFSRPMEGLLFVVGATATIFELQNDSSQLLTKRPAFWTCAAFLLYYTPNVLLYFLADTLMKISPRVLMEAMLPTTILSIISYLLMTKAFRCFSQQMKLSGASSS